MLEIINITKSFSEQTSKRNFRSNSSESNSLALNQINLKINEGEFFSLLGPSGCGKTTLLRIISGLEIPSSGALMLDGQNITDRPAQSRPFNMVFQRYALFPHLTVLENLQFGLKIKKLPAQEIKRRVDDMLQMVDLTDLADRYPETLSGGQAQRVALARAIVNQPRILLLDEPLSALDLKMREQLQRELVILQKKIGLTFIHVTHDQEEAVMLSDRIAVMNKGRIEQVSTPKDLYTNPVTEFVHEFVGSSIKLAGTVISENSKAHEIKLANGQTLQAKNQSPQNKAGTQITAYFRPEKIVAREHGTQSSQNTLTGVVSLSIFRGPLWETHIDVAGLGNIIVTSTDPTNRGWKKNEKVDLYIPAEAIRVFGTQSAKV